MNDAKDANNDGNGPSFSDPHDPRWSQGATPAPAPGSQPGSLPGPVGNPYGDQPLYAPPGTPQNPYVNQPPYPPQGNPQAGHQPQPMYQPPLHQPPMHQPQATGVSNVLGIVSMVAGILGLVTSGMLFLPQLAAVVCGHLSLRRERPHRGFAIAGLVTGYVGLAIGFLAIAGLAAAFAGVATLGA
ncbi:DUF4190 domain-containing protein [Paeniglutamicibacter sp. R2-26]|uniref:DUF4190 domain-containing protein n=1 Tax=Paeniglutamicibacter sp. R2-26 TaxID=3144417 RepID=UPI003EE7F4C3